MQSLKNFLNNQSIPIVISIMALFIAFGTQDTPCLSANVCSAGSDPEFQNDLSFKSGTINKATFSHDLSQDNQYFFGDSGSSGTSTIALITKDSSNQEKLLTVDGGVLVGQSSVSEPGTIRVQTSTSPVLQIYGSSGWEDVSQVTPSPNLYNSFAGDTGSITASSSSETINFKSNDPNLTFDVQGDSVFLNSTGSSSGYDPQCSYYAYRNGIYTPSNPNGLNIDTELYDPNNCYTISASSAGSTITYTDSTTRVFLATYVVQINYNNTNSAYYSVSFSVGRNQPSSPTRFGQIYENVNMLPRDLGTATATTTFCLEQNKNFELAFPVWTNGIIITGTRENTYIMLNELPELSAVAQTNGCTNGVIN